MRLNFYIFILFILFSFTACSQQNIPNYYSNIESSKKFNIIKNVEHTKEIKINDVQLNISNITKSVTDLENMKKKYNSNEDFIKKLNEAVIYTLDNINFNQDITYNYDQKLKDGNLLFTKKAENGGSNPKTLLLTTTYFNSSNTFNPKNISVLFEVLRLFENFNKEYNLSVLFINNSKNLNNSVNYYINSLLFLNLVSVMDIQFEDTVNDINILKLNNESNLANFIKASVNYNSFNFTKMSEITNKNNFNNLLKSNVDFVKIVSGTNTNDINKCSTFLVNIIADILNKPKIPSISVYDPIIKITLDLENYDTVKHILYKANNSNFMEMTNDLSLNFNESINITFKVVDLFGNESEEIKTKFFNTGISN